MPSGRTKFVVINVGDLNDNFEEGEEVSIETLKERRMLKPTGKERNLPLKVGSYPYVVLRASCFSGLQIQLPCNANEHPFLLVFGSEDICFC